MLRAVRYGLVQPSVRLAHLPGLEAARAAMMADMTGMGRVAATGR